MKKFRTISLLFLIFFFILLLLVAFLSIRHVNQLSKEIQQSFDGKRWSLPAVVYARPLELFPGMELELKMLEKELQLAGYREESTVRGQGGYTKSGSTIHLITRDFVFPSGLETSLDLTVTITGDRISQINQTKTGEQLPYARLDPARIGSFHPLVHEDRLLVKKEEVPELLRETLMAVEDRNFLTHHGISPLAIGRALLTNLSAGKTVQGGSTLTQQLVKNLFLNRKQTLKRKLQEAVMAVILEYHYDKDEILTAYINEVFLGQDRGRAIHGFGLASQFYFRRDLNDLSVSQMATLVGMVKGPSYYDPRRNPENCLARRKTVLEQLVAEKVIDEKTAAFAQQQPLTEVAPLENGFNRFPAFLELLQRQLLSEYHEEDLKSTGLKILTTLDPQIQWQVEQQLLGPVREMEQRTGQEQIEGAAVVTGRENGEILAIAGGRTDLAGTFNRAIDAQRPIGSLVKPAVYLAALANGYTLSSPLLDSGVSMEVSGKQWRPENYDRQEHGWVALYTALAKSYNLATVRLGMKVGLPQVISTLNALGYPKSIEPYPSLLLGAISMSPLEVTQIYQTIASGGFYQPLRSIRAVIAADNSLINRYGLEVEQHFPPELMFLLTHALQRVMEEGTGMRFSATASRSYAGKTGTSDNLRDSWFAGFAGDRLAVVWLGRDDNKEVKLTGATGALVVWGQIMTAIGAAPLEQIEPSTIGWSRIDTRTLKPTHMLNRNSTLLPYIAGTEPNSRRSKPAIDFDIQAIENEARKFIDSLNKVLQ